MASISSSVEHSMSVPVEASILIFFSALQIKALFWTFKSYTTKSSVVVVPEIVGVNLIITFFPSTETRLILTSPNFGLSTISLFSGLNMSPEDNIVGSLYKTHFDEDGILVGTEHWILVPEFENSYCLSDLQTISYSLLLPQNNWRFNIVKSLPSVVPLNSVFIIRKTVVPLTFSNSTVVLPKSVKLTDKNKIIKISWSITSFIFIWLIIFIKKDLIYIKKFKIINLFKTIFI